MQMESLMLMALAVFSGCSSQAETTEVPVTPDPVVVEKPEPMSLVFASVSNARAMTRLSDKVIQLNGSTDSYRPVTGFHFVSQKDDVFINSAIDNPSYSQDRTESGCRYYHSAYCYMENGVNGCLAYAKAGDVEDVTFETDLAKNTFYGSLSAHIPDRPELPADIYFEPVSIYGDVTQIPDEATTLADALTGIVKAVPYWPVSGNSFLQNLFSNFTNRGFDIPGSAASVKQWMQALSAAAHAYLTTPPSSLGDDEKDILADIETAATTAAAAITVNDTSYPRSINLPDGAAVLRWTEVDKQIGETIIKEPKFVPQLQTTTLDDITSVSLFVFPPALYYFVDSDIRISKKAVTFDTYKGKTTWNDVLDTYFPSTNGIAVTYDTKVVALEDPLQYAVARLAIKVKADNENLKYADGVGNTIAINDGNTTNYFRLTGVIVGGQRLVNYKFEPASNLDSDLRFVYDSQVQDKFYLTTTAFNDANAKIFNTLVLQSAEAENLNIILEFEYTGGQAFKCLNGYVYPNTRFYLVGEVEYDKFKTGTDSDTSRGRVFTKDYTTTIEATVTSLEKAYNVLPSILSKNLEIGVMTTPKWTVATPSDAIVMD